MIQTLLFSSLKSRTQMNILNLSFGQVIRKNITVSNHRCIKEQKHLELIMIEQFKMHHMSMVILSLLLDSRMEKLPRSEEEEDIKISKNLKSILNFVEKSEKILSVSVFVL